MRFFLAVLASCVLAFAPRPVPAQSFYTSGSQLFTATNPGIVSISGGSGPASVVSLTAGTAVGLTAGATVTLAAGTNVGFAAGASSIATQPTVAPTDCSVTVGASAAQVIAAATTRQSLILQNVGTGTIGFKLTGTTPVIAAAGTFTLAPGATWTAPAGLTQSAAVWAIGSAAGQVLSCTYFN